MHQLLLRHVVNFVDLMSRYVFRLLLFISVRGRSLEGLKLLRANATDS